MSKRTTSIPSSDTPAPRRAAARQAPQNDAAALPKPRTRKRTAAPPEVAAADSRPAPQEGAPGQRPMPTHDQIAVRAYYIALERGFSSDPMADWLLAERELTGVSA